MGFFGDLLRQGANYDPNKREVEYYEDTHDSNGVYYSRTARSQPQPQPQQAQPRPDPRLREQTYQASSTPSNIPGVIPSVGARSYNNIVSYEPRTSSDVESLIVYLRQKEPAIVNLNAVVENDAQRILDFVCGAIFALNGTVSVISTNIYLLSPEGVAVNEPIR